MIFVHFMKCVLSLDAVGDALEWVCLRCAAAEAGENQSDMDSLEKENSRICTEEKLERIFSDSMVSTVHVVRANIAMHLFTAKQPWNRHRFNTSRFFRQSAMRRKKVQDQDNSYCNGVESVKEKRC